MEDSIQEEGDIFMMHDLDFARYNVVDGKDKHELQFVVNYDQLKTPEDFRAWLNFLGDIKHMARIIYAHPKTDLLSTRNSLLGGASRVVQGYYFPIPKNKTAIKTMHKLRTKYPQFVVSS